MEWVVGLLLQVCYAGVHGPADALGAGGAAEATCLASRKGGGARGALRCCAFNPHTKTLTAPQPLDLDACADWIHHVLFVASWGEGRTLQRVARVVEQGIIEVGGRSGFGVLALYCVRV